MTEPSIAFDNVYRRFGNKDVLRGVTFEVEPGQVYALLGRNGAGKTTSLRLALGFLSPHHGQCRVLGRESEKLTPQDRGRIGFVAEGHKLYHTMTAEGVFDFERATRPGFDKDYAMQALRRCAIPTNKGILRLSRGQKAQVSLIASVSSRPEVLIFDDPAMGLDVVMRREFLDVMIDLLADQGASVLFSSHILTDVERMADKIGIMHEGRMIVDATLDDLKTRVTRCSWRPRADGPPLPPNDVGIVRRRNRRGIFELTIVDLDDERIRKLRDSADHFEVGQAPGLEDLFLDLVTANHEDAPNSDQVKEDVPC